MTQSKNSLIISNIAISQSANSHIESNHFGFLLFRIYFWKTKISFIGFSNRSLNKMRFSNTGKDFPFANNTIKFQLNLSKSFWQPPILLFFSYFVAFFANHQRINYNKNYSWKNCCHKNILSKREKTCN